MSEMTLPDGWLYSSIEETISFAGLISDGDWVESKDQDMNGSIRLIQLADIGDAEFRNRSDRFMNIEQAERLNCTFLNAGDLLVARMPDPLGRACIFPELNQKAVTVVDVCLIRTGDSSAITNKLLMYWINSPSLRDEIWVNATGTTRKRITRKKLEQLTIPLPPLAEQKVIADQLDTLLAQVERTKARLERVPDILKQFRQSVLAAAVSGKLTEGWREENNYDSNGYPTVWQHVGLSEVGVLSRGKSKHRPRNDPKLFGSEYPFIQTGEVANSNGFIASASKFYSEFGLAQSKLFPKGTLCITIAANIADTSVLSIDACFPDSIVGFIPNKSKSDALFVKYLIDFNKENLEAFAPATAQKNINLKVLNEMKLPFPPLEEQTEIVRRVEALFAHADKIEQQAQAGLARVNQLTQSILAKAFRGELTAQWRKDNPELISGDNSAEALLVKIRAEKAVTGGKKIKKASA